MPLLPCHHQTSITDQVQPTIKLLKDMDNLHPDILIQHGIQPIDYHGSLIFRSAIESIRGTYIASTVTTRETLVGDVLENLSRSGAIHGYQHTANNRRYDFEIALQIDLFAAIEVKGGEGNSINISERPIFAKEFGVWCHLDGAVVNQPAHGAHSIVNRITNELVRRNKVVDVVFFKDILCGTRTRPCPKYPGKESSVGFMTAPDVFLFPKRRPVFSPENPDTHEPAPPVHKIDELRLPQLILDLFNVKKEDRGKHVWEVHVELEKLKDGKLRRIMSISHEGKIISSSRSRAWIP